LTSTKIAVLGAGSWGTAIAVLLSRKGYRVHLWAHSFQHVEALKNERENSRYLSGIAFDKSLAPLADLQTSVEGCEVVCMAVPSQFYRSVFRRVINSVSAGTTIVSAAKGIENDSLLTMTQVMEEESALRERQGTNNLHFAVLSGPSFAREVAEYVPTAVTIGCKNTDKVRKLQNIFGTSSFRVYASSDVIGLEISGAFKNIIAIAAGICDGIGYGHNTRAALITRGLAEITRLGLHVGADAATFSGLSGMGDLILTCTGDLSRNRGVGLKLGSGQKIDQILSEMSMVAEGVKTTLSAYSLAKSYDIEMPILEQVYKIIYENKNCTAAVDDLLARELKSE